MFAFSAVPLLLLVGAGVDYARLSEGRANLNSVADAAALAAVSPIIMNDPGAWDTKKLEAIKAAQQYFKGLSAELASKGIQVVNETYEPTVDINVLKMKVCWEAKQATTFMNLASISEVSYTGCSTSQSASQTYATFYFLVDVSGSMGIGATAADQVLMQTKTGCTFACHTTNWVSETIYPTCNANKTTPCCAKLFGARTRFDVVKDAIATVLETGQAAEKMPNQFQYGIYKFSNELREVQSVTTDYAKLKAAVGTMTQDEPGGTNIAYAMQQLSGLMPDSGDGTTPSSRKIFLILLTDGVEGNVKEYQDVNGCYGKKPAYCGNWSPDSNRTINAPGFWFGSERSQAINAARCTPIKQRGIRIATLNTEYLVPVVGSDSRFTNIRNILVPVIRQTMEKCATDPSYAYYASSPEEISAATDSLFKKLMEKARLLE